MLGAPGTVPVAQLRWPDRPTGGKTMGTKKKPKGGDRKVKEKPKDKPKEISPEEKEKTGT
jgi:hypothetical protein